MTKQLPGVIGLLSLFDSGFPQVSHSVYTHVPLRESNYLNGWAVPKANPDSRVANYKVFTQTGN